MKILVHGSTGRMGRILCDMIASHPQMELAAQVAIDAVPDAAKGIFNNLEDVTGPVDCVLDFSNHTATPGLMAFCGEREIPVVVATTGHTPEEKALITQAAEKTAVFFSANMSIGVALLADLAKRAAAVFPQADIEIIEKHHNQKLDVPSGTALMLAKGIQEVREDSVLLVGRHENGKRTQKEIGIHAIRLGNEVGTHEIILATGTETITLKHEAENRSLFADGALAAAVFLAGKPAGMYTMKDII